MRSSTVRLLMVVVAAVALTACNNTSTVGQSPAEKALSAKLEKGGQACIQAPTDEFPYSVSDAVKASWSQDHQGRLAALQTAGLMTGTPEGGKTVYRLTDEGAKAFTSVTIKGGMGQTTAKQFCYGKRTLKAVVTQTDQPSGKGPAMSVVKYQWTVADPAPWAANDAIKAAYGRQLALEGQSEALLVKTNDGWKAE